MTEQQFVPNVGDTLTDETFLSQLTYTCSDMSVIELPLPPLVEQQRIVQRVDDLMTLCDWLEVSLEKAETTLEELLEALLDDALEPAHNTAEDAAK